VSGQAILATPEAPIVTRRPVADQIVKANAAPLVWLITGQCVGDTNQIRALADALHWPTVDKPLRFNPLRRLPWLRGPRLDTLTRPSRLMIRPPWPDLIIGAGYGGVPVARWIRRQNGGATRIVMFGNPRSAIDDLDLVITTPQYDRAPAPNVLALPLPVGDPAASVRPTADERAWLANLHAPRRLVVVGGPARNWTVD
jgi:mitochondrial fission protein ELM1